MALDKVVDFGGDEFDVGAERIRCEAKLDELDSLSAHAELNIETPTHLLLFHELRIRAVVHDILAKHGASQGVVDLFGVDVLGLAVQDEVVTLGIQADGHLPAEQNEGEDIAVLRSC